MSKFWSHLGHLSCCSLSQRLMRSVLSRLNLKSLLPCLLFSFVRGRSSNPCPSFPSNISSTLCLLSSSSEFIMSVLSRCFISLFIMSWHLWSGVLDMNSFIWLFCGVVVVQSCEICVAYLWKSCRLGEGFVAVLLKSVVNASGKVYRSLFFPRKTPFWMVFIVPFMFKMNAGIALRRGDVIPIPPYFVSRLVG